MANVYRSSQRPSTSVSNSFSTFYEKASRRLQVWNDSLPSCYAFSTENMKRAADNGKIGIFMTIHAVYHATMMKLCRYTWQSTLSSAQLVRRVSIARYHAETLLSLVDALAARGTSLHTHSNGQNVAPAKFSSPFVGYSIVSATDILTAKVPLATISTRIASFSGAQAVLAELAFFWHSAKKQQALVFERVQDLAEFTTGREVQGPLMSRFGNLGVAIKEAGEEIFQMKQAMEKTLPKDYDCIYA